MKKNITLILIVFLINTLKAQEKNLHKGSFYAEFIGNSYSIVSVNYEMIFHSEKSEYIHYTTRIGLGTTSRKNNSLKTSSTAYNIPLEFSLLIGKEKNCIETGIGWTPSIGKPGIRENFNESPVELKTIENIFYFRIGYRRIINNSTYRFAPLIQLEDNPIIKGNLTFGFSCGYSW